MKSAVKSSRIEENFTQFISLYQLYIIIIDTEIIAKKKLKIVKLSTNPPIVNKLYS